MFNGEELKSIHCQRILADFKGGLPVILKDKGSLIIAASAENISEDVLNKLQKYFGNASLILTPNRSLALNLGQQAHAIDCMGLSKEEIDELISLPSTTAVNKVFPASDIAASSIELAKLNELLPATIVSKVNLSEDTSSMNAIELSDILWYKKHINFSLKPVSESPMKFANSAGRMIAFRSAISGKEHYAIIVKDADKQTTPLVRIHSSCFTGDLMASLKCDCREQLHTAIEKMGQGNGGIVVYLNQEGRGIGLANKLRAYNLQTQGYDTVEANEVLGFDDDSRMFAPAANILKYLQVKEVELLTNNPRKLDGLKAHGIEVRRTVPHVMCIHADISGYLKTKAAKLNHKINFG